MKKVFKYILRILLGLILMICLVLILAGILIQTSYFKKKLPAIIEKQASGYINGNLTVGEVDGDFFTGIVLKNVLLMNGSDTVSFIPEISANYRLWTLLSKKLEISSVKISYPIVFLKQINDSTWNLQHIIKLSEDSNPADTLNSSSSFEINLSQFNISEGKIRIEASDTLIPKQIEHFNTEFSLAISDEIQEIKLGEFSLKTKTPDLNLQKISFHLKRDRETIKLNDFYLKTAQNQIELQGQYKAVPKLDAYANLQSQPLVLKEFEFFLPGIEFPAHPVLNLEVSARNDSLFAILGIEDQSEHIRINLGLANFPALVYNQVDSLIRYKFGAQFRNINLVHWAGKSDMDYIINGTLSAEGKGIDPENLVAKLKGDFNDCMIEGKPVRQLSFSADVNHGDMSGNVQGRGEFGEFSISPNVQNFMGKRPAYQVNLFTKRLDFAQLTGIDSLKSNINMEAHIYGHGFDPKTLAAKVNVLFSRSKVQAVQLDTLMANFRYSHENIELDSLWLETQSLDLNAHGNYSIRSNSDLTLSAELKNMNEFGPYIPLAGVATSGKIDAWLWGRADSLNLNAVVNLNESMFDSVFFENILIKANARLSSTDTIVNARLTAKNIRKDLYRADSVSMDLFARPDSAFVFGKLANHDLKTEIKSGISWGNKIRITLTDWLINYKDQEWALRQAPAILEIDSSNYRIRNFKFAPKITDSTQYIYANGIFSMNGKEDFKLNVSNMDIERIANLTGQKIDATGSLNLIMHLNGSASSPKLSGKFGFEDAILNHYKIAQFDGHMEYESDKLKFGSLIIPEDSGRIELTGELPVRVRLDSVSYNFNPSDHIEAKLTVDQFPLAIFQTLNLSEEISGFLEGTITSNGTLESPNPEGNIRLRKAALRIPEYGIKYNDIALNINFLQDKINLDTFKIVSSDGDLTASGQIDFNSGFYKGDVSNSKITVNFNTFNPFDHRQFNMQVSGNASIGGEKGNVVFDGDLNIPEAEIYLPFIFNMMGKINAPEIPKPILVQELSKMKAPNDSVNLKTENRISQDSISFDYFQDFTGKIRVKIPKNTWIKNDDMHIELSGDLELMKSLDLFEVFGTVDVVRGQYDLFGKTFVIDDGTLTFKGGEDLMPEMNIKASYGFRNSEQAQQKLTVAITGTASSPKVSFSLDGNSVNEGDAISYMMFGKGMNELTIDQQDNLAGSGGAGSLAEKAAASLLSSQITKFLGDKLDVDYLEIKSDGGFENATVAVGKYITNDLFVSYEQRFGETKQKDIAKYEVKLEYELFKFLFLQLNNSANDSGIDVIFKLNSK